MKIAITVLGILLLISCFVGGILIHNKVKNAYLRDNINKIYVGMPEAELKSLLGEPTCRTSSDIAPREYWGYGVDTFSDNPEFCGSVLIEMTAEPRTVRKVLP